MNSYRTNNCGELRGESIGKRVKLAGWVDAVRDHGGIVFIDLRDHFGITQIVVQDEQLIKGLMRESVISAEGLLRGRSADTINPKLPTGEVELAADSITVLGACSRLLPFEISESVKAREELRLKYRFLDLRNEQVHQNIIARSGIISFIRRRMEQLGFIEIQTPILTSSSPEGARDYLVPSRKHHGMFYALPQAPQIFKQLLMVSGFDRYFQIAPCFRDEDSRADRSPGEFYQLDFEMAFADQEDVFAVAEQVMYDTFHAFSDKRVSSPPFRRLTFAESMLKYGTDKPDLRNPLSISDMTELFSGAEFPPFKNKPVRGIKVPGCHAKPRSFFDRMLEFAVSIGMKGLGYITMDESGVLKGPIVKFLPESKQHELISDLNSSGSDTVFFIGDFPKLIDRYAGQIRTELGSRLSLIDESSFEMCFITDFPMFGVNEETGALEFTHNPFSMPQGGLDALNTSDPLEIKAFQYDIVCNGVELSSGAVRNHRPDIMEKAFEMAGYSKSDLENRFSALFNAFHYGAPPHAGMAPGIDSIVRLLTGEENLREVIAFPMNSSAQDLLLQAPAAVSEQQLREVHIRIR